MPRPVVSRASSRSAAASPRPAAIVLAFTAAVAVLLGLALGAAAVSPPTARAATGPAPVATGAAAATSPSDADYLPQPAATTGPWVLADRLVTKLNGDWLKGRGVYGGTGNLSIRMNAMLLELHALAARTGHQGPARQDARIAPLVRFFTTAPVVVRRTKLKRATAQFPHVPAFEAVFTRNTLHASLHPSADAIIVRALAAVWQARAQVALPPADAARMQSVVKAVADGPFYRKGQRAEDQINWNADVASANWVINRDRNALRQYRDQLIWFADHTVTKYAKGGATVLSPGGSFRYSPQFPDTYGANASETAEYANLVHEALGFYGTARAAGMAPLGHTRLARLERWSRHVVYGTWTHAGYLNWDSGLSTKRRHIRQYWGFALDSLLRGSLQGGIIGSPGQRAYIRSIAQNGLDLFMRSAWNGKGAFPSPTSFGAPNGFHDATQNAVMAPLRFALVGAELALTDTRAKAPGNMFSDDTTVGRLTISTPDYNTAILRSAIDPEGGLEPTRLFDGLQRPLTTLAADAFNGPAPGLRLTRGGGTILETQPGHGTSFKAPFVSVSAAHRNTSGQFQALGASNTA
ncbi:MAG: hypothetical protein REI11_05395 [Patulibacter sp.]|nr:hypothetical protein [Patulibacter sp.]